ncbi:LysE/ArgO family amino acid transporter [Roseibaca sp. Y0-43]|uniref:LysE/ArgO family amino acid transporter n=1 Tax=Roseibaca sp. Y0-43 TaxID=2816854 RepID=UPI001D0C27A1|nr:LysE/ArgO family amino acid transporter [Roseibaca sp. Y0-43]MCC1482268.1 amino acid transporter [Roseibaca sp. Y0-43]
MIPSFLSGFGLGMSLILAIGPQNAFVLRQGLRGEHVAAIVAVCVLSDAVLIAAGVAGFTALVQAAPWVVPALRWGGAAFLAVYALRAARAAWRGGESLQPGEQAGSLGRAVMVCLALTWLNPHVYIDTLVLLGAVSVKQPEPVLFGVGAALASLVFFAALGFGARVLRPFFAKPVAWRVLDGIVALTMGALALRLALG